MQEALILSWVVMAWISTLSAWVYRGLMDQHGHPQAPARSVVIVPIKGRSPTTDLFLASLRDQDHPHFHVVFAVESEDDPAVAAIRLAFEADPGRMRIVVAGLSTDCGQKIWNMRAAIAALDDDSDLVVFTDADVILPKSWLSVLNWAVVDQKQEIVTGYRLILPKEATVPAICAAAINLSVALAPRLTGFTAAWGGTMAMRRGTLDRLDLATFWDRALSDDMQLTAAAKAAGILVHTNRRTLLPSPWSGDFRDFMAFAIRQFRILRLNDPLMHVGMTAVLLVPIGGLMAALADLAGGGRLGGAAIALVLAAGALRGRFRRSIVAEVLRHVPGVPDPGRRLDGWLRPFWWSLFALAALAGSFGNTIRWAGIVYRCAGPKVTAILARQPSSGNAG